MIYTKVLLLLAILLSFSSCAQKAKMENMTVKDIQHIQFDSKFKNSINILKVEGGKETNPLWTPQINDEEFQKALIKSLRNSGLFSKNAHYNLKVDIFKVEQPSYGLDLIVTITAKYTLIESKNHNIIFDKIITTPYTATFSNAFLAVKRLELANEGAAKKNIQTFLVELSKQ